MRNLINFIYVIASTLMAGCVASNPTSVEKQYICPGIPPAEVYGITVGEIITTPALVTAVNASMQGNWATAEKHYRNLLRQADETQNREAYREYMATGLFHALCIQGKHDDSEKLAIRYDFPHGKLPGDHQLLFEASEAAYQRGDYKAAIDNWLPLAKRGHAEAAFRIAEMYDFAEGVSQNYVMAARFYLSAADRGHGESQCRIAGRYDDGLGVRQDVIRAYQWYRICLRNTDVSDSAKRQATMILSSLNSLDALSNDEFRRAIERAEAAAKNWRPTPSPR